MSHRAPRGGQVQGPDPSRRAASRPTNRPRSLGIRGSGVRLAGPCRGPRPGALHWRRPTAVDLRRGTGLQTCNATRGGQPLSATPVRRTSSSVRTRRDGGSVVVASAVRPACRSRSRRRKRPPRREAPPRRQAGEVGAPGARERRAWGSLRRGSCIEIGGGRRMCRVDPPPEARGGAVAHRQGRWGRTSGQHVDLHRVR